MTTILTGPPAARTALKGLLQNYSFEMTAKDVPQLEEAAPLIPPGTKIAITSLPSEDSPARVEAARRMRERWLRTATVTKALSRVQRCARLRR